MGHIREALKRHTPAFAHELFVTARERLSAPPYESIALHAYSVSPDPDARRRLTLVIPSIAASKAFGGVTTGLDVFLQIGRRTGADLRIVIDDFEQNTDLSVLRKRARACGIDPETITVEPRRRVVPRITVRPREVFFAYTCWIALNLRTVRERQTAFFGEAKQNPLIYLIQEYEPQFYPFSSTHLLARSGLDLPAPFWGIVNSRQLFDYCTMQGHRIDRAFVLEPKLTTELRPFLGGAAPEKVRRILVYGRPRIPRNCFPAVMAGLERWSEAYPQFRDWEVVSAGAPHKPLSLAQGRVLRSLGKLTLEQYADLLRTTAIGLSLMSSPHPSYPPLEMVHFGILTLTNRYANKDLGSVHDNIVSLPDISAATVADSLAQACERFARAPEEGWQAQSHLPSFLAEGEFPFLDEIADALGDVWSRAGEDPTKAARGAA